MESVPGQVSSWAKVDGICDPRKKDDSSWSRPDWAWWGRGELSWGFLVLNSRLLTLDLGKSHIDSPYSSIPSFSSYSISMFLEFWPQPFCSICMPYHLCLASSYSFFKTLAPIPFLQAAISDLLRRTSLWDSVAPDLSLSGLPLTTWHPVLLSTVTRFQHLPGYYTLPGLCICYSLPRMLFLVFFTRHAPTFSRPTTNASPPRGPHSSPRPPLGPAASIPPSSPHLTHGPGWSVCPPV